MMMIYYTLNLQLSRADLGVLIRCLFAAFPPSRERKLGIGTKNLLCCCVPRQFYLLRLLHHISFLAPAVSARAVRIRCLFLYSVGGWLTSLEN